MANRLKEIREARSLSQRKLANLVDCSQATILQYEKGAFRPSHRVLARLVQVLQVPAPEIFPELGTSEGGPDAA